MRISRMFPFVVAAFASSACGKSETPIFHGAAFGADAPAPGPLNGLFLTTDNGSDLLSAVDPATRQVRFSIPVGFIPVELEGPHHLAADPAGRFVYINSSEAVAGSGTGPHGSHGTGTIPGFVLELSTKDGSQVAFAQVDPNPGDLTVSPDGKTIYVTHYDLVKLGKMTPANPRLGDSNLVVIDAAPMNPQGRGQLGRLGLLARPGSGSRSPLQRGAGPLRSDHWPELLSQGDASERDHSALHRDALGDLVHAGRCEVAEGAERDHGDPHTGNGRLNSKVSIIPEDTISVFPTQARAVVVEKVRHGKFFNIGGVMPLYSVESLSDQQIADVLAYIGL